MRASKWVISMLLNYSQDSRHLLTDRYAMMMCLFSKSNHSTSNLKAITQSAHAHGLRSVGMDIRKGYQFDLLRPSGLMWLICITTHIFMSHLICCFCKNQHPFLLVHRTFLRLAFHQLRRLRPMGICPMGTVCSQPRSKSIKNTHRTSLQWIMYHQNGVFIDLVSCRLALSEAVALSSCRGGHRVAACWTHRALMYHLCDVVTIYSTGFRLWCFFAHFEHIISRFILQWSLILLLVGNDKSNKTDITVKDFLCINGCESWENWVKPWMFCEFFPQGHFCLQDLCSPWDAFTLLNNLWAHVWCGWRDFSNMSQTTRL